jgi:transposase InsO family protein
MSANQASFPIAAMARVLGVSRAGHYARRRRPPSAHAEADAALLKRIRTIHAVSRQTYGAPRVHAELWARGERHGRKRIARLMREAGLVGASHRRGGPTTTRRDKGGRPAPDLVDRDFSTTGPNRLWVADSTLIPLAKSGRHQSSRNYVRLRLRHLGTFRQVSPFRGHDGDPISRSSVHSHVVRRLRQRYLTFTGVSSPGWPGEV